MPLLAPVTTATVPVNVEAMWWISVLSMEGWLLWMARSAAAGKEPSMTAAPKYVYYLFLFHPDEVEPQVP
jgi:hypothetical protein